MKLLSLIAIGTMLLATSCHSRGDYVCVCQGGFSGNYYEERKVAGSSKKDGRNKCQALGDPVGSPDGIYCDLKQ